MTENETNKWAVKWSTWSLLRRRRLPLPKDVLNHHLHFKAPNWKSFLNWSARFILIDQLDIQPMGWEGDHKGVGDYNIAVPTKNTEPQTGNKVCQIFIYSKRIGFVRQSLFPLITQLSLPSVHPSVIRQFRVLIKIQSLILRHLIDLSDKEDAATGRSSPNNFNSSKSFPCKLDFSSIQTHFLFVY